jgi:hypothetical protein
MKSYFDQLKTKAGGLEPLLAAFKRAGVATSVFYRAKQGRDLTYRVARRVDQSLPERS